MGSLSRDAVPLGLGLPVEAHILIALWEAWLLWMKVVRIIG